MKIAELLHFCLTAKRSGVINITHESEDGYIYISDGEVVAAHYQELSGEEAFFALLMLSNIESEFTEKSTTQPKSINKSTHFLLMEAARLSDEASASKATTETKPESEANNFCLKFITMDNAKFALQGRTVLIGRGDECDITVPDVSVSSNHCQILWNGKNHILSDSDSANGTYVNNELISASYSLCAGDHIQVGLCHFLYEVVRPTDKLDDPKAVVPFTFGSQTQKITPPPKNETGASKFASQTAFKEFTPVAPQKKKIHIWPFGNKS